MGSWYTIGLCLGLGLGFGVILSGLLAANRAGIGVAVKAGAYAPDNVAGDLFQLARGAVAGRGSPGEITLFKSVGTAIEDLAAAVQVWETVTKA